MNWRLFGFCHKLAKSLTRSAWCFVTPELDNSQSWLQANLVCCGSSKQWTLAGAQEPSFSGKARIALSYRRVETKNPRPTCVVCRRASIQTLILTQASIHTLIKWTCIYSYIDHSIYSYIDQITRALIHTLITAHIHTLIKWRMYIFGHWWILCFGAAQHIFRHC